MSRYFIAWECFQNTCIRRNTRRYCLGPHDAWYIYIIDGWVSHIFTVRHDVACGLLIDYARGRPCFPYVGWPSENINLLRKYVPLNKGTVLDVMASRLPESTPYVKCISFGQYRGLWFFTLMDAWPYFNIVRHCNVFTLNYRA